MNSRNLENVHVITIDTDTCVGCARTALERIESMGYETVEEVQNDLIDNYSIKDISISIYTLSDFMLDYNDELINADGTFLGYVSVNS